MPGKRDLNVSVAAAALEENAETRATPQAAWPDGRRRGGYGGSEPLGENGKSED